MARPAESRHSRTNSTSSETVANSDPYLEHRDVIERVILFVCRRHRMPAPDAEDFASVVRLHLLADDAAVLRSFRGGSSIRTYLTAVITHQFQDWRNRQWGKWRPSAEARRIGPLAILLETRLARDGFSMDEAVESLRTNHGVTASRSELETIAARFPTRTGRSLVAEELLDEKASETGRPDDHLHKQNASSQARRACAVLETTVRTFSSSDQLLLSLRFNSDMRIVDIARLLGLEQRPLYRRLESLLEKLRVALEGAGIGSAEVVDVLEYRGFDFVERGATPSELNAEVRLYHRPPPIPPSPGRLP
jgi:RNA polymerase sigma factor (sigma-70 family)